MAAAAAMGLTAPCALALPDQYWDVVAYEDCITKVENDYINGVINERQFGANFRLCCLNSGGVWSGPMIGQQSYGDCSAPPPRTGEAEPVAPGATEGVSDDPTASPLPTPRPTPPGAPTGGVQG